MSKNKKHEEKKPEKNVEAVLKALEAGSTSDLTPDTASGQYRFIILALFMVLGIAVAMLIFRYLAGKINPDLSDGNTKNPLFYTGQEGDDDIPDIPGTKVYDIRKDIPEIEKTADSHEKEFNDGLKKLDNNTKKAGDVEMMKQRDQFAGEKLRLLKKIDQAATKKERVKAIRELEKNVGEKN